MARLWQNLYKKGLKRGIKIYVEKKSLLISLYVTMGSWLTSKWVTNGSNHYYIANLPTVNRGRLYKVAGCLMGTHPFPYTHQAPKENIFNRMMKKMVKTSKDVNVRVSDDEMPYKSKNPYLPRNVYEHPPRAHIRTPFGLFVSTDRFWEIQYRAYVYRREHKYEGLEMHVAELERRFKEQRLIS